MPLFRASPWLQKNTPLLLGILLALLMAGYLAWQVYAWRVQLAAPSAAVNVSTETTRTTSSPEQVIELFGPSHSSNQQTAPLTNLRLTLMGSFVNADSNLSSAMILPEGSQAQRFTVGSEITPGVRLEAVYRDRVELSRNARRETLTFPADNSFTGMTATTEAIQEQSSAEPLADEQSTAMADQLRALREQLEQSEAADSPTNPATGNE